MKAQALHALQQALQGHLLNPEYDPGACIVDTDKVPRAVRLHIYANAYRARLFRTETENFYPTI